ncbi:hypothetical protein IRZ83_03460 [Flavobacterium sp. JLP]|uniref:DUF6452 family protein n=1 Tax=unclassified Flavobacterium TaxID=196869 RepID=UPI0004935B6C|nr:MULTISPECIES: DUF6452 family protein [unclassified Flavobacterium]MBF4491685.1 hypothetical protein [Flavobacterium sp. MR2016-29]MBF4505711.1 hypothetical protein [Flavobacterium sp. JLP]
MKKIIAFLLLFTFGLSSCEKDDICDPDTPTTPRLVITFYNANSPSELKEVTDLKVTGEGQPNGIIFNESGIDDAKYLANGSTISIPLRTDATSSTFKFVLDSENDNPAAINEDEITFNYKTRNVYVSRACGFKTIFELNQDEVGPPATTPFTQIDSDAKGLWMQQVYVKQYNVEFENETHIEIYF